MGMELTQTVNGVQINNAYIKILRFNIQGTKPQKPVAGGPTTNWTGSVVLGTFASKALADAGTQPFTTAVVQLPTVLTVAVNGNLVASVYAYLKTLSAYSAAVQN